MLINVALIEGLQSNICKHPFWKSLIFPILGFWWISDFTQFVIEISWILIFRFGSLYCFQTRSLSLNWSFSWFELFEWVNTNTVDLRILQKKVHKFLKLNNGSIRKDSITPIRVSLTFDFFHCNIFQGLNVLIWSTLLKLALSDNHTFNQQISLDC